MPTNAFDKIFRNETVFVTGHTGFIGVWLSLWLHSLGAKVVGFSLEPPPESFFQTIRLEKYVTHIVGDIRDQEQLENSLTKYNPKFVFHLAAQPLVHFSYEKPVETFQTNVMGTVNILDIIRKTPSVRVGIIMTSDKCYENREQDYAYKEDDPMGGFDPYSASKGAAEIVTASYRNSFFNSADFENHKVGISTARAGNVIGGGDWAKDRVVPDSIRSIILKQSIPIHHPNSIRPWQHVFEPISGMLCLAMNLLKDPFQYAGAWNFGPLISKNKTTVKDLVNQIVTDWGHGKWTDVSGQITMPHEAKSLMLDSTKAIKLLGWKPVYSLKEAIGETVRWYHTYSEGEHDMKSISLEQIEKYIQKAKEMNIAWTSDSS